jgi:hypothetical protein
LVSLALWKKRSAFIGKRGDVMKRKWNILSGVAGMAETLVLWVHLVPDLVPLALADHQE